MPFRDCSTIKNKIGNLYKTDTWYMKELALDPGWSKKTVEAHRESVAEGGPAAGNRR